jgi:hypothetical protein
MSPAKCRHDRLLRRTHMHLNFIAQINHTELFNHFVLNTQASS